MKVDVDPDRCEGHARCWGACPEVFELDDEGHAFVLVPEVPTELEERVRQAAAVCPERAIQIV